MFYIVAKFYKNSETFACISHPSTILNPSQVNDNYCDCPDGSDEPGTSACTHLSPLSPPQPLPGSITGTTNTTTALPGFYCKNKGHNPEYISFTYVNDGVCDYEVCCDGSDEWEGVGGVKCEDRCAAMGKEYRKKAEARAKAAMAARKKREELVKEAAKLRSGIEDSVRKLEVEIVSLKAKEADAKKNYEEVERRERGKVVSGGSGKASKVSVLAGLAKVRVEELREALLGTVQKRDEARAKVAELEAILSTFKEEYNPNFNDEGVKRAVNAWDNYAASKSQAGSPDNEAEERDINELVKPDDETNGINWAEWDEEEESDVEAREYLLQASIAMTNITVYRFEEYLPIPVRNWVHEKIRDFRILLIENGILADNANSGSESKLVTNARAALQSITDDLGNKERTVGEHNRDLETNYGPEDVFRSLKGKCVSQDSGEYVYELCWMDRATQKPKKGGGATGMGNFVRFDRIEVDDVVTDDGKGLGTGERLTLVYENGQHCWNGPNRQTTVVVACAEKDEIWKISELEKCIYQMDIGTPAACGKTEDAKEAVGKDEL